MTDIFIQFDIIIRVEYVEFFDLAWNQAIAMEKASLNNIGIPKQQNNLYQLFLSRKL